MASTAREALTFEVLDDLVLAHERGREISVQLQPGACLGSLVELHQYRIQNRDALQCIETPETAAIRSCLRTGRPAYLEGQAIGFVPTRRVKVRGEDLHWTAFQYALQKAMLSVGFPSLFARGMVGAMGELEDNVHEHSGAVDTGLIAYRVSRARVEWCVADRGTGVLAGLRSGAFPSLNDPGEALKIALMDGRSRFGRRSGRGYGFRPLFKALAARQGSLRFRSDDQVLTIAGVSPSLSQARLQQRASSPGFAVTVICAKPGKSKVG